jgi:N-acetylglucosamine-6-phosphate deacetylase
MTQSNETLVIVGGEIYAPAYQSTGNIFVRDGKIQFISAEPFQPQGDAPVTTIDATGCKVIPGLIDALVHGGGGYDTISGNVEDLEKIARAHAANGVTSIVMATSSASMDALKTALEGIAYVTDNSVKGGSRALGSYVEGKFGSPQKHGAQDANYMSPPNFEEFHDLWAASDGTLKVISIAPENDKDLKFTRHLAKFRKDAYNNIVIAMGHTNATYEQAIAAIEAGVTRATHTYNSMSGMHHRAIGVLEAVYSHPNIHAELIADGQHVKPIWGKTLIQWKGVEGVGLITDCLFLAGVPEAEWKEAYVYEPALDAYRSKQNPEQYIKDGAFWLNLGEPDEMLSGGMMTLMQAVRNVVNWGYTLEEAVTMATISPAKNLYIDDRKGSIAPGKDADIVILDDNLNVKAVIIEGEIVKNELS